MANYSVRNISVLRFSTRIAALALLSLHISFAQVEPKAGTWSTWVASPVNQLRLPAPPAAVNATAEIQTIKSLMAEGNDTTRAQIAYWDAGSPAYRWEQIAAAQMLAQNVPAPLFTRGMALLSVAIYDATVPLGIASMHTTGRGPTQWIRPLILWSPFRTAHRIPPSMRWLPARHLW